MAETAGESPLTHRVLAGSMWLIGATGVAKALGFGCQLALAWFLTKEEFGVYAIAVSLSVLLSVMRDGGLPMILEQKGSRFNLFAGPVFWMMLAINSTTGLLIGLVAVPAAHFYAIPELARVIALFAISVPLGVLPAILSVRMAVNLQFRQLGIIQLISAVIRNTLLLYFAHAGFGASSFLLPLLITNVTDTGLLWLFSRYSPWAMRPRFRMWPNLFRSGRWVVLGTFAIGLGNNGAYFLLGKILPADVLGTYFFAYQLVVQLGVLLSDNVYQVLAATFARFSKDVPRVRRATLNAMSVVILIGAAASMSIAVVFKPLEALLWHGKWAAAAPALYVLSLVWPAAAGVSVLRAVQMASGRFRQWGLVMLVSAFSSIAGTVLGAHLGGTAACAGIGFGVGAVAGAALNACITLSALDVNSVRMLFPVLQPWLITTIAAVCAIVIASQIEMNRLSLLAGAASFIVVATLGLRTFARESFSLVTVALRGLLRHRMAGRSGLTLEPTPGDAR